MDFVFLKNGNFLLGDAKLYEKDEKLRQKGGAEQGCRPLRSLRYYRKHGCVKFPHCPIAR